MARLGRCVFASLFVALTAAAASAQSYWAVEDGSVLVRDDGVVTVAAAGGFVSHGIDDGSCAETQNYVVAADGDVVWASNYFFCQGWIDPDGYELDPPLTLLDLPLTTGKTWSQWTTLRPMYGWDVGSAYVEGEVIGPTQVTVSAGTFDVIEVRLLLFSMEWEPPMLREPTLLLHPNLGDVTGLVSWQGVVPSEAATWSSVKAAYR